MVQIKAECVEVLMGMGIGFCMFPEADLVGSTPGAHAH